MEGWTIGECKGLELLRDSKPEEVVGRTFFFLIKRDNRNWEVEL